MPSKRWPKALRTAVNGEHTAANGERGDQRGQTHVLGVVLIIGMVFVGAAGVIVMGLPVLATLESNTERERAEGAMTQFTHGVNTLISTGDGPTAVSMGPYEHGHLETRETGQLRVVHVTDTETVVYDEPLGAVVYTNGEYEFAYQGGGLWKHGDNRTVALTAPPIQYDEDVLTFSLVGLTSDERTHTTLEGTVDHETAPMALALEESAYRGQTLETGDVHLELESPYCDGWERYFEDELEGSLVEGCVNGTTDRLVLELDVPERIASVDSAITASELKVHGEAPPIEGDVRAETVTSDHVNGSIRGGYDEYPSVDSLIERRVAACEGALEPLETTIDEPGVYCTASLTDEHTIDTSDGDVELVVRESVGDPNFVDDLTVTGEHNLTVYVDGDLSVRGNATIGNTDDPAQTRVLVSSNGSVSTATGSPTIAALVYARDSTVALQGTPTLEGAVVADRVTVGNIQPGIVRYNEGIDRLEIVGGDDTPRVQYVQLTRHDLEVSDDR